MKNFKRELKFITARSALMMVALFPMGASAFEYTNSLVFQGVTFNTGAVNAATLQLQILNATGGSGNWSDITEIKAIDISGVSDGQATGGSIVSFSDGPVANWTSTVSAGAAGNALGCVSGDTSGVCFSALAPVALDDDMVWQFSFAGTNLNFDYPHLKVQFMTNLQQPSKPQGDLLSQNIPAIPEPEIYAMMTIGLGLLGWIGRRRKLEKLAVA